MFGSFPARLWRRHVYQEAAFDCFIQVPKQFNDGFTLGGASRNGGNLSPEATLASYTTALIFMMPR
jgi:hypothetical protein